MEKLKVKKSNSDIVHAIKIVDKMRKNLVEKYGVTDSTAIRLIEKANKYNPKNEDEAYIIIHKIFRSRS